MGQQTFTVTLIKQLYIKRSNILYLVVLTCFDCLTSREETQIFAGGVGVMISGETAASHSWISPIASKR